ncbi:MAG: sce7725 family protein [Alcaligenaceae bacterium]|nr:sce7725 family protein [Alcaligenaceae bacterium]
MYFPYLRGKQFELIALRQLCSILTEDQLAKISPVIEPVKLSSTLSSTISEMVNNGVNFNMIINPTVGDMCSQYKNIIDLLKSNTTSYTNYQVAVILDSSTKNTVFEILDYIIEQGMDTHFSLIHRTEIASDKIEDIFKNQIVKYNLIDFSKTSRRYYRKFDPATLVSLDDYFQEEARNADYLDKESDFSNEFKFYKQDGFVGFSDFLTVGENYSEAGFLPRAVAIHLSYIENNDLIRIKHFVSDSNDNTSDIAGKFAQAVEKLVTWCDKTQYSSSGVKEFKKLYERGHFPGLGVLKKLSIINHIELVVKHI